MACAEGRFSLSFADPSWEQEFLQGRELTAVKLACGALWCGLLLTPRVLLHAPEKGTSASLDDWAVFACFAFFQLWFLAGVVLGAVYLYQPFIMNAWEAFWACFCSLGASAHMLGHVLLQPADDSPDMSILALVVCLMQLFVMFPKLVRVGPVWLALVAPTCIPLYGIFTWSRKFLQTNLVIELLFHLTFLLVLLIELSSLAFSAESAARQAFRQAKEQEAVLARADARLAHDECWADGLLRLATARFDVVLGLEADCRISVASPMAEELLGVEVIGANFLEQLDQDDAEILQQRLQDLDVSVRGKEAFALTCKLKFMGTPRLRLHAAALRAPTVPGHTEAVSYIIGLEQLPMGAEPAVTPAREMTEPAHRHSTWPTPFAAVEGHWVHSEGLNASLVIRGEECEMHGVTTFLCRGGQGQILLSTSSLRLTSKHLLRFSCGSTVCKFVRKKAGPPNRPRAPLEAGLASASHISSTPSFPSAEPLAGESKLSAASTSSNTGLHLRLRQDSKESSRASPPQPQLPADSERPWLLRMLLWQPTLVPLTPERIAEIRCRPLQ